VHWHVAKNIQKNAICSTSPAPTIRVSLHTGQGTQLALSQQPDAGPGLNKIMAAAPGAQAAA
jgi:hypothetical protein